VAVFLYDERGVPVGVESFDLDHIFAGAVCREVVVDIGGHLEEVHRVF